MKEYGIVKDEKGEFCAVAVMRKTACGDGCANCAGCMSKGIQLCKAKNTVGAKKGDRVIIEGSSSAVLKSAFLVYIVPIIVFILVYTALCTLFPEAVSAICAVFATVAVFVILHFKDNELGRKCMIEITEIVNSTAEIL